jgi:hypothetical protein
VFDVGTVPVQVRAAAAVVAAEAVGLLVAAGVLAAKTITGSPESLARALLDIGLALFGAALLALGAWGLLRLKPGARAPVLVMQILAVPVGYSLAFQADRVGYGGPILVAAITVLYLLFTPPARTALERPPRE